MKIFNEEQPFELILASHSPRRKQILEENGYQFKVITPEDGLEEKITRDSNGLIQDYVRTLAMVKADNVCQRLNREGYKAVDNRPVIILACDSIAFCNNEILGKPRNRVDAGRMLEMLKGSIHEVYTGIALSAIPEGTCFADCDVTELKMDPLTPKMITDYLDSNLWQGKAGAFGYQDGNDWLHIRRGDESNVVGLPLPCFRFMLKSFLFYIEQRYINL